MFASSLGSAVALLSSFAALGNAYETHIVKSEVVSGASIEYKQTTLCETTPGVRSFSGYLHMPGTPYTGAAAHNASLFFWFFEARHDPHSAPLTLYLGGGPGATSLGGVIAENGPCYINPDSNSTYLNEWSWNNKVNMLYVDQPSHVGYSYDEVVPSILSLFGQAIIPANGTEKLNETLIKGELPTTAPENSVNTTLNAARLLYDAVQVWTQEFPEHKSSNDKFSIWANSYGGHYAPLTMEYFLFQNQKLASGALNGTCYKTLCLDTVGTTNGCLDTKIEGPFYPEYAYNNTYGVETIPKELYEEAKNNITKPGGFNDLVDQCREAVALYDPQNIGTNETVNEICGAATMFAFDNVQAVFTKVSGRNYFDISREKHSAFPNDYYLGFFNQDWVRKELGAKVNFTTNSLDIQSTFLGATGDLTRPTVKTLDNLVSNGIKVALIHGDRDYRCNWLGGEALSLAIQSPLTPSFHAAGYANIATNASYTGGLVRQVSGLSFSRVFQAGHAAGAFQPETVSKIFDRVMFNVDVATGTQDTKSNGSVSVYATQGPLNVFSVKNELKPIDDNVCYLWDLDLSCKPEQQEAVLNGTAVFKDYVFVKK